MKRLQPFMLVLFALCVAPVLAQGDCPALVEQALNAVDSLCQSTGRNQACYGNVSLDAEPQPGVEAFKFEQVGDTVDVADVQSMRLSPMDVASGEWGVALMRLQANLPDTLPGQNVTVLLFGAVELRPAYVPVEAAVTVTASSAVNVRSGPSTSEEIVGSLAAGTGVTATGRSADGSWLRVRLDGGRTGWMSGQLVRGETATLNAVQLGEPVYRPMQAFYFRSGVGDAPCAQAPDSGILVQTPQGAGVIDLRVNEVDIQLGSTAYLQAGDALTVSIVEGSALVTAFDETQVIPQGAKVAVPLDENLAASGPPGEPVIADDLKALPLGTLERKVQMAEPPTTEALGQMVEAIRETMQSSKDFIGLWEGTDIDGSYMTLQIHPLPAGRLYVRLYDQGASACGKKVPLDPAEGVGEGQLDANGALVVTFQVWCLRPEREDYGEATFTMTYDSASNALADSSGVTWKHFGR